MKTTADFLDALRVKLDIQSDNALGKYLGIHRQTISHYRTLNGSFDDEMSIRVAEILAIEPAFVMACMHHQRAKNPQVKKAWAWTAQHLGGLAAALAVLAVIPFYPDIVSGGSDGLLGFAMLAGFTSSNSVYYVKWLTEFWPLLIVAALALAAIPRHNPRPEKEADHYPLPEKP